MGVKLEFMAYTPQQIANYFLRRSFFESIPLSPLKLIKLVYIAYGWHFALKDEKLFLETIEAWQHGPVIPTLYHEFKHRKKRPIREYAEDYDEFMEESSVHHVDESDEETLLILSKVWASYKNFTPWALREKTHEKDGPWDAVCDRRTRDVVLNDDDIKAYYVSKIRQYLDAAKAKTT